MFYSTLAALDSGGSSLLSYSHARVALEDDLVQNLHVNQHGRHVGGKPGGPRN
jgi:hypothetical protein